MINTVRNSRGVFRSSQELPQALTRAAQLQGIISHGIKKAQPKKEVIHIDAAGQILGRLASKIALLLRGKDKRSFVPNKIPDRIIYVEHINTIKVTGRKIKQKIYHRHSMYPGGLKSISFEQMLERNPRRILEWAVYGMLPKNRLRARMMQNLIIT